MIWTEPPVLGAPTPLPGLHPLVAETLLRRGIHTLAAAQAFLDPRAYPASPATDLPGLASAVDRLAMAIRKRQTICVWGDFDADGQTSTTILVQTLRDLDAEVIFHIPVRASESHGVNIPHLEEILGQGARLILTCDTGISAHAEVEFARERGVDMIITDHHDLPESLPPAVAVVNPKLLPAGHPLATLSGSGVAYKLSEELFAQFGHPDQAAQLLDLAAIGLVADLARLTGDARYLVQCGLETLRNTHHLGLQTIMEMAELVPANLTEEHIGFVLGPRLNALGRLGDANSSVELLTTSDPVRARVLATQLEGMNAQRQLLCSQVTRAAESQLLANPALLAQPVLVLGHPSWPGGVVGIVASRLVERYRKPAILFSTPDGEPARGSARSVEGLNISAAIAAQKDLLLNFGGHPMAAGLSLEAEKLPEFTRRLARRVVDMLGESQVEPALEINAWLSLPEITLELARQLESLAPYGPGNEKLILATRALRLQSMATIGRNREHLKMTVTDVDGNSQTVLWWDGADEKDHLPQGHFDLAYTLRASDWRGTTQVQLEFVDFRSLELEKITARGKKPEIFDYRNTTELAPILFSLKQHRSCMLWIEGIEKKEIGGKSRHELEPADVLAIWTTPPSPEVFREVLARVNPRKVYLFAVTQAVERPEAFIERLYGLLKFAINQRAGKVTYSELETATAQRGVTVSKGLQWLVAQGRIKMELENENELIISSQAFNADPAAASRLWDEIRSLLEETAAYRAYFKHADKEVLFD